MKATGQNRDFVEPEPEETNDSNETGDEQGEEICPTCGSIVGAGCPDSTPEEKARMAIKFWETCAKLQIPLNKFNAT